MKIILEDKEKELFVNAHYELGSNLQNLILMEECSELTLALPRLTQATSKLIRGKPNYNNLAEEMSHVMLMILQMKEYYGLDKLFNQEFEKAYERLDKIVTQKQNEIEVEA